MPPHLHNMHKYRAIILAATAVCSVSSGACLRFGAGPAVAPLPTVPQLDLSRYLGTWYEIANLPHHFQKGCQASQATYTQRADGNIDVLNSCHKDALDGPISEAHGVARRAAGSAPGQLEVRFFWPFWAHYHVIELAPDYSYAVVGHPGRKYLWILSRQRQMDGALYAAIVARMQALGFATENLRKTIQPASP
jgi:apolipoprotein D and lipocalin family protein